MVKIGALLIALTAVASSSAMSCGTGVGEGGWVIPELNRLQVAEQALNKIRQQKIEDARRLRDEDHLTQAQRLVADVPAHSELYLPTIDKLLNFLSDHPHFLAELPWLDLMEFAKFTSLLPMDMELQLSNAIAQSTGTFEERKATLKKVVGGNELQWLREFTDEIMGVPSAEIEHQESRERANSGRKQETDLLKLGVGAGHEWWFSKFGTLVKVAKYIHQNNLHSIADLGSGTGRLCLLIGFLYPDIQCFGLELHEARVKAAQTAADRWFKGGHIHFIQQDLLDLSRGFPSVEAYYIFGPTNDYSINFQVVSRLKDEHGSLIISNHFITDGILESMSWLSIGTQIYKGKSVAFTVKP